MSPNELPLEARGRSSQTLAVKIPAAAGGIHGLRPVKAAGRFIHIISAPTQFYLRMNQGPSILVGQGAAVELTDGDYFDNVELFNPTSAEIIITIFIGFARYIDQRQAVIEPKTEFDAWDGTAIPNGSGQVFSGTPSGSRIRRKAIQVSNNDPASDLQVRDEAGHVGLIVKAGDSITLPVSETITIFNATASPISCAISEIWWTA